MTTQEDGAKMDAEKLRSQEDRPYFCDLIAEIREMRRQNAQLKNDLEIARKSIAELQEQINGSQPAT